MKLHRTLGLFALLAGTLPSPAGAQGAGQILDDQKGRWAHYEVGYLDPIAFGSDPSRCFTINQPGSRIFEVSLTTLEKGLEIPTGPGLAALALRPGTNELWAVDRVTAAVSVIRTTTGRVERTVRVGAEPHGIVFTADGDRAYVTCSAEDRVDVIDATAYAVAGSIAIPAKNPRAIVRIGDWVYVAPFLSGNGTAPRGNPLTGDTSDVVEVVHTQNLPGITPLPDRDLFAFRVAATPGAELLDPSRTVQELGTILYSARHRPGTSELWISHTDALNGRFVGEKSFIDGQVVRNRIAIVDTSLLGGGNNPAAVTIVDLDALAPKPSLRCAEPTDIAFTSDGRRAFVCGYGSDKIAVLGVSGAGVSWQGTIHVKTSDRYPNGVGPRCLAVSPDDRWLVVSNKGENSFQRIELRTIPAVGPFERIASEWLELGFDPTPGDLIQGRVHFIRASNSSSFTSACNSCHVDGYTDGLVWDLGTFLDPESTPSDQLAWPLDDKGPMTTQSVRHLREVGPYHWRGERKQLKSFNQTFVNLLERNEGGVPKNLGPDFLYIVQYMEHLAIPPNHRQERDRSLTPEQQEGLDLFLNQAVLDGLSCSDCHALPLGTSGELVSNRGGGHAPTGVVPQLRGVADRLSPPFFVGGDFGTRTELGAGLNHAGGQPSFVDLLLRPLPPPQVGPHFQLTADQAAKIASFLEVFDTGMAPSAAWQVTANAQNVGTIVASDLAFMLAQAQAGHCDVVYRYGPETWNGAPTYFSGTYLPATDRFMQASSTLPNLDLAALLNFAANGKPVTFLGLPPLMGWTMGVDRDDDKLLDLDEAGHGADWENWDTDEDTYPDGYEVQLGMDPTTVTPNAPDNQPAALTGAVNIVYVTTNAVRLEWRTTEPVRVLISYDGETPVLRAPLKPRWDDTFSEVVAELEPGRTYDFEFELQDLNQNFSYVNFPVTTLPLSEPEPARLEELELIHVTQTGGEALRVRARLTWGPDGPAPGYAVHGSAYYVSDDESVYVDLGDHTATSGGQGNAIFFMPIPGSIAMGAGKLYFSVEAADPPGAAAPYVEGMDALSWGSIDY